MEGISIEKLVWASRTGDRQAYSVLMERYYRYIYLTCLSQTGDVHDAEDLCQEVFIKGYQYCPVVEF